MSETGCSEHPPIQVVIGNDAHTTVFTALQFLGLGQDRVERVATDDQGRMRQDAFAAALARSDGPKIVITQAGQINTGAFDDHKTLVEAAHEKGAWVHVGWSLRVVGAGLSESSIPW